MEPDESQTAALLADLLHPDKPILRAAVDRLITLAGESPGLRDLLYRRLAETDRPQRWPIAYVLAHLPQPSAAALQTLLDGLDHPEADIRWAIGLLLGRIAGENKDGAIIPSLTRLCAGGSANQRRMALYVIRDLALTDPASLAALLRALQDAEPTVRVAAAICLKLRSDIDEAGKHRLLEVYLNDGDARVRHATAMTLASLGVPPPNFETALLRNCESEDVQTKKAARAALALLEKRRSASGNRANDP
jgi:HEAT repeat protein